MLQKRELMDLMQGRLNFKQHEMKQVIFNRWNFTRFLRLVLGIVIIVQSIMTGNQAMGIAGILFVAIPLFNIGCCATGSCSLSPEKTPATTKEIIYEEVL